MPIFLDGSGVIVLLIVGVLVAAGIRAVATAVSDKPLKYEFDHHVPGLIIVAGVVAVGVGALLPWIVETSRAKFSVHALIFGADVQPEASFGGLDNQPDLRTILTVIIVCDICALLLAIGLMATHRRRGLLWRTFALVCGAGSVAIGAAFIAAPEERATDVLHIVAKFLISARPGMGAYLLLTGGLLIAVGSLVPGRRRATQPLSAAGASPN